MGKDLARGLSSLPGQISAAVWRAPAWAFEESGASNRCKVNRLRGPSRRAHLVFE